MTIEDIADIVGLDTDIIVFKAMQDPDLAVLLTRIGDCEPGSPEFESLINMKKEIFFNNNDYEYEEDPGTDSVSMAKVIKLYS